MGHQKGDDVGLAYGLERLAERQVGKQGEFLGEPRQVRIGDEDAVLPGARLLARAMVCISVWFFIGLSR